MTINCPKCGTELELPDGVGDGQKIQCTICQEKFFLKSGQRQKTMSSEDIGRAYDKFCASGSTYGWRRMVGWRGIVIVVGLVFIGKLIVYFAGMLGAAVGTHVAKVDKAAFAEILRVADQHGDWIAAATNNLNNTSQTYRGFVFDLISSAQALSDEFSRTKEVYEELGAVGQNIESTGIAPLEAWVAQMNASIAKCRTKSKTIILKTKIERTSSYYKVRKSFLGGMYYLMSKHLDQYELMAATMSEAIQCKNQYAKKKGKTKADEQNMMVEFQKILERAEKIEKDIKAINATTMIDEKKCEKILLDGEG